jgi:HAE1 family hydrophobic/amphiphilic exporter-1
VRLTPEARTSASDLRKLPLLVGTAPAIAEAGAASNNGPVLIPLGQIAEVKEGIGPAQIDHVDRERVISVEANVVGADLGTVTQRVNQALKDIRLPAGYEIVQGGEVEDQREVFGDMFTALGTAVLLMYLVLVIQFRSFLDPIAIMMSLPLSLIGVVLALLLTGGTINIMSLIGVILLMGIVAKNSILLIDFAKWNNEKGMPLREALIQAGRVRLRPILMTTFALVAAMIPVALGTGEGADFRAPLGRAVIGGVITSTILTLLVIPTFYEILSGWRERMLSKFRGRTVHGRRLEPHSIDNGE